MNWFGKNAAQKVGKIDDFEKQNKKVYFAQEEFDVVVRLVVAKIASAADVEFLLNYSVEQYLLLNYLSMPVAGIVVVVTVIVEFLFEMFCLLFLLDVDALLGSNTLQTP